MVKVNRHSNKLTIIFRKEDREDESKPDVEGD